MGHVTCVCFDFVVPAWKLELPVRQMNKMDVMLILQCYYQQRERTSVQFPSRPWSASPLQPRTSLPAQPIPLPSSHLGRACGRGLASPGVTENTFPSQGYVTMLFLSGANSSVFGGSALHIDLGHSGGLWAGILQAHDMEISRLPIVYFFHLK